MSAAPARVAVVMAVHDNGPFVEQAIASLQQQSLVDWECVVVDDCSTDEGPEIVTGLVARDERLRLLRRERQGGSGAARNAGLAVLDERIPYLAFLDGDDLLLPDALAHLVAALEGAADAVGAYGVAEYLDEAGAAIRPGEHPARQRDRRRVRGFDLESVGPEVRETTFSTLVVSGPIWPAAVALHRLEIVRRIGGFDESLRLQQDWDLYLRQSRHGRFLVLDEQVAWYRQHGTNVTHRQVERVYFQDAVRHKTWASGENTADQRREAARGWRALQHRRVLHGGRRTLALARSGQVREAGSALAGTTLLAAQLLSPGPPRPSRRLVRLTGRSV